MQVMCTKVKPLPPFPGGFDAANGTQDLRGEVETGVGVALDFVLGLAAP